MTHINDMERSLLRILLAVLLEAETRSQTLKTAFYSGYDDIEIIDVSTPFKEIAEYFDIPYLTPVYCRDTLTDEYYAFLNGTIDADALIDKIAEHIEWLRVRETEIGGRARITIRTMR